jgi:hypothetical protein
MINLHPFCRTIVEDLEPFDLGVEPSIHFGRTQQLRQR